MCAPPTRPCHATYPQGSLDEEFLSTLTSMIGHLRRQSTLVKKMRSKCPLVADTRWLSMAAVCSWTVDNIILLQEYYSTKQPRPTCIPSIRWWLFTFAVHSLATEANIVFKRLQAKQTLLSQQSAALNNLVETYARITGMQGPLPPNEISAVDTRHAEVCGLYALTHAQAKIFMMQYDPWIEEVMENLHEEDSDILFPAVAKMFVQAADGISKIIAERTSDNAEGLHLPPVLPHQLERTDAVAFVNLIKEHTPRLQHRFSSVEIHQIGKELSQLRLAHAREESLRETLSLLEDESTSFEDGWKPVGDRFSHLRQFCGDLASTFPNTATVESDFSVLGWEKDVYRKRITDFSLEGVMHAKQFKALRELAERLE